MKAETEHYEVLRAAFEALNLDKRQSGNWPITRAGNWDAMRGGGRLKARAAWVTWCSHFYALAKDKLDPTDLIADEVRYSLDPDEKLKLIEKVIFDLYDIKQPEEEK